MVDGGLGIGDWGLGRDWGLWIVGRNTTMIGPMNSILSNSAFAR